MAVFFPPLAFSIVSVDLVDKSKENLPATDVVFETTLDFMVSYFRDVDIIGRIGKNKIIVVLPHHRSGKRENCIGTCSASAPCQAFGCRRHFPSKPRVAGVVAGFDAQTTPDAAAFANTFGQPINGYGNAVKKHTSTFLGRRRVGRRRFLSFSWGLLPFFLIDKRFILLYKITKFNRCLHR